jgi:hypothetical protein
VSVLYVASAFDDKSQRLPTLACHNRLPPTVVTHNTMSPELLAAVGPRFGQLGFPERGGWQSPRPRRWQDGRRLILPSVRHPGVAGAGIKLDAPYISSRHAYLLF